MRNAFARATCSHGWSRSSVSAIIKSRFYGEKIRRDWYEMTFTRLLDSKREKERKKLHPLIYYIICFPYAIVVIVVAVCLELQPILTDNWNNPWYACRHTRQSKGRMSKAARHSPTPFCVRVRALCRYRTPKSDATASHNVVPWIILLVACNRKANSSAPSNSHYIGRDESVYKTCVIQCCHAGSVLHPAVHSNFSSPGLPASPSHFGPLGHARPGV